MVKRRHEKTLVSDQKPAPYKQVVIFGPDYNDAFELDQYTAKTLPGCLIIGDGIQEVTLDQIRSQLEGKIDSATRIDIFAHGAIYHNLDKEEHIKEEHIIVLDENYPTRTSSLFKLLAEVNQNKPVYTHLWSCYAANAEQDFQYLPENSFAVFHSSKDSVGFGIYTKSRLHYDEYNGKVEGVKSNLLTDLDSIILMGGTVKFGNSKKTRSITYLLNIIPNTPSDNVKVLATEDVERDFEKFAALLEKELGISTDNHKKPTLAKSKQLTKDDRDDLACRIANLEGCKRGIILLHLALKQNKKALFQVLLDNGLDINTQDKSANTALHLAIIDKNYEEVRSLLEHGANPNIKNSAGETALNLAIKTKGYGKDGSIVDLLLLHKADTSVIVSGTRRLALEYRQQILTAKEEGAFVEDLSHTYKPLGMPSELLPRTADITAKPQLIDTGRDASTRLSLPNLESTSFQSHTANTEAQDRKVSLAPPPPASLDVAGLGALAAIALHSTGLTKTKTQKEWEEWGQIKWQQGEPTDKENFKNKTSQTIETMFKDIGKNREELAKQIAAYTALANDLFDTYGVAGKRNYRSFLDKYREPLIEQSKVYEAMTTALIQLEKQIDLHKEFSKGDVELLSEKLQQAENTILETQYKPLSPEEMRQRDKEETESLTQDLAAELKIKVWGGRFGAYNKQRDSFIAKLVEGYAPLLEELNKAHPNFTVEKPLALDRIVDTVTGEDNVQHVKDILQKGDVKAIETLVRETLEIVKKEALKEIGSGVPTEHKQPKHKSLDDGDVSSVTFPSVCPAVTKIAARKTGRSSDLC